MLQSLGNIGGICGFTALSTLITGYIFDDNYTVFQFGKMCGCAFSHIAFTIKTGHANLRINKS